MNESADRSNKQTHDILNTHNNNDALEKAGLKMQMGELRRAYHELEKSRDYYSALCDFCPSAYLILSEDGLIVDNNHAAANLFGLERNKLKNRRLTGFISDQYKDFWNRHCLLTKQGDNKQSCELSLLKADGTAIYVQLDCLYKQKLDNPSRWLISLTDITAYKQIDEALRIAAVAFETQDGIVVTDANKMILRVNEAFTRITGYSPEEAINQDINIISPGNHDESYYQAMWMTIMSDGYWQGEIWVKRKNGETYPAWLTITAVFDKNGCVSHYVGSIVDITAQKQAEKILLEARHRLENEVTTTKEELEKVKKETAEINSALTVLLKHQASNKNEVQRALAREVEETILPFLKKLKTANAGRVQSSQLLNIIEDNLTQLVGSYGRKDTLPGAFQQLTPLETQVASMVRQGMSTKVIAKTLNISEGTVSIHRNHIRKKLGLNNKSDNLQIYLKTLFE